MSQGQSQGSQFRLLAQRRFLPFFGAQAFGVAAVRRRPSREVNVAGMVIVSLPLEGGGKRRRAATPFMHEIASGSISHAAYSSTLATFPSGPTLTTIATRPTGDAP